MFTPSCLCRIFIGFVLLYIFPVHAQAQLQGTFDHRKGLTFTTPPEIEPSVDGLFTAICGSADSSLQACNRISGDMACNLERPILCFLDIDAPVPIRVESAENWVGGVLALSSKVKGNQFGRLSDANAYCTATFGDGWRVASFHDGAGEALKGYGVAPLESTRFWIDIKDQPKATCWSR